MNRLAAVLGVWLMLSNLSASEARLPLGAKVSEAYTLLGAPSGKMELPGKLELYYETAELTFVNGQLAEARWWSQEEAAAMAKLQADLREDWEKEQAILAQKRLEQGQAILLARKTNPQFLALPAAQRLSAWADFVRNYPEIDAIAEYEAALADVRADAAQSLAEDPPRLASNSEDAGWSTSSLIDTVQVGNGWRDCGWYASGPSVAVANDTVVVVGGYRTSPYGYYPRPVQQRPILSISYRTDNFGVQYSSGGYRPLIPLRSGMTSPRYSTSRQPVIIIQGNQ